MSDLVGTQTTGFLLTRLIYYHQILCFSRLLQYMSAIGPTKHTTDNEYSVTSDFYEQLTYIIAFVFCFFILKFLHLILLKLRLMFLVVQ